MDKHWNGKVKKLLKQAGLQAKGENLLLAERVLKAEGKQQPVLFAQAASEDALTKNQRDDRSDIYRPAQRRYTFNQQASAD